jgi:hypothetical protein
MLAQHRASFVLVNYISFPSRLNLGRLILDLQRHQFYETAYHLGRAQHPESFQFASSLGNVLVVIEVWPHLRILCEESQYLQTLTIESLVHIAATLPQHYFYLTLRSLKREHAAEHRSDNRTCYARYCSYQGWIHLLSHQTRA